MREVGAKYIEKVVKKNLKSCLGDIDMVEENFWNKCKTNEGQLWTGFHRVQDTNQ